MPGRLRSVLSVTERKRLRTCGVKCENTAYFFAQN